MMRNSEAETPRTSELATTDPELAPPEFELARPCHVRRHSDDEPGSNQWGHTGRARRRSGSRRQTN